MVEFAWNRCNVPSSIFSAITPWQVPEQNNCEMYQTKALVDYDFVIPTVAETVITNEGLPLTEM